MGCSFASGGGSDWRTNRIDGSFDHGSSWADDHQPNPCAEQIGRTSARFRLVTQPLERHLLCVAEDPRHRRNNVESGRPAGYY